MEDGTKGDPAQRQKPRFLGKAGWLKKAQGRLLASYKARFVRVENTEVGVYENEDLQKCLERLDMDNYDKCHELKSPFKKKNRLILVSSPKSGNKVQDVKFQAQTAEEKDAWIKALGDAISRAKNKVFDEVKVDESSNLEHVTRTRPKGNRGRRPPTRIHMKEVAGVSSDGILRLDLDLEDAVMPNGTHHTHVDGSETFKKAADPTPQLNTSEDEEKQIVLSAGEEGQNEQEASPQKKAIKPPMPPTKEAKPTAAENEPDKHDGLQKKVIKPPMPPSKEAKPCALPTEEATQDQKPEQDKKKTGPPPTPPHKPTSSGSPSSFVEASQMASSSCPPAPPSKEVKPSHPPAKPEEQSQSKTEQDEEEGEDVVETTGESTKADELGSEEAPAGAGDDQLQNLSARGSVSDEESLQTSGTSEVSNNGPETQPLIQRHENLSPVAQRKEGRDSAASDASGGFPLAPGEETSLVASLQEPLTDSLSPSPFLCQSDQRAEEKSVDSGQHSIDDSEGSGSEDTLVASTAACRGSHPGLDTLDPTKENLQSSVNWRPASKPLARPRISACRRSEPSQEPLKPSTKAKSASSGDLLSETSGRVHLTQPKGPGDVCTPLPNDEVVKLQTEVALEMEKTGELLKQAEEKNYQEGVPEDLLTKAMEKLRKADDVLREVKKLKLTSKRMSW